MLTKTQLQEKLRAKPGIGIRVLRASDNRTLYYFFRDYPKDPALKRAWLHFGKRYDEGFYDEVVFFMKPEEVE